MRTTPPLLLATGLLLSFACQPIVIGNPYPTGAENHAAGGSAGASDGGNSNVAGAPGAGSTADAGEAGAGSPADAGAAGTAAGAAGTSGTGGAPPCLSGTLALHGHAASPQGAPIAGLSLELTGRATGTTKTDANGSYNFEHLCAGNYRLTPRCTGSALDVQLKADQTLDFPAWAGACELNPSSSRALIFVYDPLVPGSGGQPQRLSVTQAAELPEELVQKFGDALRAATNGHVRLGTANLTLVTEFPPLLGGYHDTAASYAACQTNANACSTAGADYAAISSAQQLCSTAVGVNADEIWLIGGAHFGFDALKPLQCPVTVDGVDTIKTFDVVGLSYGAGLAGFFADYQARSDQTLSQAFAAPAPELGASPYGLFTQVQSQTPGSKASGCGSLNIAPNALTAKRFDDARLSPSYCDAFLDYPLQGDPRPSAQPRNCEAWGCTELGYRRAWFSYLPKAKWLSQGGKLNDFWRYILHPEQRAALQPVSVNCSASYLPGWCEHVRDGLHGECNSSEWATPNERTGWVEYLYQPKQLVTQVLLYDRACAERVLSGHLEFSDGSPDQPFGALEDTGKEYLSVSFAPKLLSGLRVVIDDSDGVNPGFGEVSVSSAAP